MVKNDRADQDTPASQLQRNGWRTVIVRCAQDRRRPRVVGSNVSDKEPIDWLIETEFVYTLHNIVCSIDPI